MLNTERGAFYTNATVPDAVSNSVRSSIRVLLIEDDESDYLYFYALLMGEDSTKYTINWAETFDDGRRALVDHEYDICFLDYRLGVRTGVELLREVGSAIDIPVILLTGGGSVEIDSAAMCAGAADYFDKRDVTLANLERSIRYAMYNHLLKQELRDLAHKDELTGLDNLRMFKEKLHDASLRASRGDNHLCLLFIELSGFKRINDQYGRVSGDLVLKQVAERICGVIRRSDVIVRSGGGVLGSSLGRLGGDEFAIILPDLSQRSDVVQIMKKILLALTRDPYSTSTTIVHIGASIGAAFYPDDCTSADELIRCADLATYAAKKRHGNHFSFYRDSIDLEICRPVTIQE